MTRIDVMLILMTVLAAVLAIYQRTQGGKHHDTH